MLRGWKETEQLGLLGCVGASTGVAITRGPGRRTLREAPYGVRARWKDNDVCH